MTLDAGFDGETFGRYALRIGGAALVGFLVAKAYRASTRRPAASLDRHATTLVLLTVLVAMTALVVDDSVARAFSLVGALAIVRFRTFVEATRDTAFVIFAVVAGMTIGVGNWMLCVVECRSSRCRSSTVSSRQRAGGSAVAQLSCGLLRLGGDRDPRSC
jgi:hypothetical protein